jgi:hypothetical protein
MSAMGVLVFTFSMAVVAEEPWPVPGDKIFVAAPFAGLKKYLPASEVDVRYSIPSCMEFEVTKADPEKLRWVVKDGLDNNEELEGAWLPRMHKSKAECQAQVAAEGEPKVGRSGMKFKIKK